MCGICGIVTSDPGTSELEHTVWQMTATLRHRGPDGCGVKICAPPGIPRAVALGHTRLAIIDLSQAGIQPMSNEDGSVWVVFNGEIYNFQELRPELEASGHRFKSHTDTEVIIHLYEELGTAWVTRLNGMFAVGILDLRKGQLILARDHVGIKPLYYSDQPDRFVFGSEIKTILASGLYNLHVNWQAIYDYFTYLYVPCPATAFGGIRQVPPAHQLIVDLSDGSTRLEPYWQVRRLDDVEQAPLEELKVQVRTLLGDSVRRQMVSDVPLGIFLSGGVDSTIVAGLARDADASARTFTVTFEGEDFAAYNEQDSARIVSEFIGTDHHELSVPPPDPMEILNLVTSFDQPFGNPTFYLMHLISKRARGDVTVALSGVGGDELFAGYPRYRAVQLARQADWMPHALLKAGGKPLGLFRDSYRSMRLRRAREFFEGLDDDFVRQFAKWTYFFDEANKRSLLGRHFDGCVTSDRSLRSALERSTLADADNRVLHMDVQTFLVDNLLEYSDKMSMAVGLETRLPLLDHRFVELSLNMPFRYKLRSGRSKILLREAFADFFPSAALKAPKRGFNVPLAQWILRTLDDYFEAGSRSAHPLKDMLGQDIGITWREGIIDFSVVQQLRDQFRQGKRDNSYKLFAVIMFDVWWRTYIDGSLLGDRCL